MMKILNATKKTTLSGDAEEAQSIMDKSIGLLGSTKPRSLLLSTRFGIHTFGMKHSIDVLILDRHRRVVAMKKHLQPNSIYLWSPRYDQVIELPHGTISHSRTEIGDKLALSS